MKEKIFNIIQIGDKSNKISRAFDIFITIIIVGNIIVTFLETFDQLSSFSGLFKIVEIVTVFVFCVEYILRIWTANYLYPEVTAGHPYYSFNTYAKNWFYYTIALYCTQEKHYRLTTKNKKEQSIHILELFFYFRSPRSIDITVSCSFVLRSFHIPRTSFCFSVRFSELPS